MRAFATNELLDLGIKVGGLRLRKRQLEQLKERDEACGKWCAATTLSVRQSLAVQIIKHIAMGTLTTSLYFGDIWSDVKVTWQLFLTGEDFIWASEAAVLLILQRGPQSLLLIAPRARH
jgi:hypothetical protein